MTVSRWYTVTLQMEKYLLRGFLCNLQPYQSGTSTSLQFEYRFYQTLLSKSHCIFLTNIAHRFSSISCVHLLYLPQFDRVLFILLFNTFPLRMKQPNTMHCIYGYNSTPSPTNVLFPYSLYSLVSYSNSYNLITLYQKIHFVYRLFSAQYEGPHARCTILYFHYLHKLYLTTHITHFKFQVMLYSAFNCWYFNIQRFLSLTRAAN